jgi:RNA polymerase sigma-70 factor (ECF subfamily)
VAIDGLQEASDGALVLAIARYHQEALAEAYRRHGGAVFALARRLLTESALAEEVTQEVFLRLWTQPDRFDPERGALRSYLLAQSHGRAVDLLRSETSRRRREEREARATAESGYDIEREVLDLAVGDHVKEVLDRLPPDERQAIELAYFGGYTYRQVADRLDQPEGTVKSRIRAGLKRMRADLVDAGIGGVWSES